MALIVEQLEGVARLRGGEAMLGLPVLHLHLGKAGQMPVITVVNGSAQRLATAAGRLRRALEQQRNASLQFAVQLLQIAQDIQADLQRTDVKPPLKAVDLQRHDGAHAELVAIHCHAGDCGGLLQAVEQHRPLRGGEVGKPLRLMHAQQHFGRGR